MLADLRERLKKELNLSGNEEDLKLLSSIGETLQPGIYDSIFGDPAAINLKVRQMLAEF